MKYGNFCSVMITSFALLFILAACYTPNNFITKPSAFAKTIKKANNAKRPFIMFSGVDTFAIIHIMVENARREMTVQLNTIDSVQRMNLIYPKTLKGKQIVLYMRDATSYTLEEPHTIPISNIARIQMIN